MPRCRSFPGRKSSGSPTRFRRRCPVWTGPGCPPWPGGERTVQKNGNDPTGAFYSSVLDQAQIAAFAVRLRAQSGRKEIFLFYQREYVPKLDPAVFTAYQSVFNERPDIAQTLSSLFDFFKRETVIVVDPIRKAYADSGATVHFLYLTRPAPKVPGVAMEEQSEDIFAPFREMSLATGGYIATTANLEAAMRSAVAAAENYYLLYYTPKAYAADGAFHALKVRLKSGSARLNHRMGYIAD